MALHYLDNSATTRCSEKAAAAALMMLTEKYGNPSSLHQKGVEAEIEIEDARETIARSLGVQSKEIYFTSGSTESNNTVLFGAADAMKRRGRRIVVSAVEHPSVYESAKALSERGYDVVFAPVDARGVVDLIKLSELITPETVLVSVMAVNNETGAIQPTGQIAKLVKKQSSAQFHVDAVQAYGKMLLKPSRWGVDFMSVSAHKVHGPKGVGALYIRQGARMNPLLFGGEQQRRVRPGTEGAAQIVAFGAAVSEFDIAGNREHITRLRDEALSRLSAIDGVSINSSIDALPYIINISVAGIRSETMLHHLERGGVYVSSSSACAKGKRSYVLAAQGLSDDRIDSSLRISFSRYNTTDDIDALVRGIENGINNLQRKHI